MAHRRFKKGSKEARAWGRKMARLRGAKEKHPAPRKRKLKHKFRRTTKKIRRALSHPIRTLKRARRRTRRVTIKRVKHRFPYVAAGVLGIVVAGGIAQYGLKLGSLTGTTATGSVGSSSGTVGTVVTTPPPAPTSPGTSEGGTAIGINGIATLTINNTIASGNSVTLNYTITGATSPLTVVASWGDGTNSPSQLSSGTGQLVHTYPNTTGTSYNIVLAATSDSQQIYLYQSIKVFVSGVATTIPVLSPVLLTPSAASAPAPPSSIPGNSVNIQLQVSQNTVNGDQSISVTGASPNGAVQFYVNGVYIGFTDTADSSGNVVDTRYLAYWFGQAGITKASQYNITAVDALTNSTSNAVSLNTVYV